MLYKLTNPIKFILDIKVGMSWKYKFQCSEIGVHCPIIEDIAGNL
jgi:hypothetical protein